MPPVATTPVTIEDPVPTAAPVRHPATSEFVYFVMTDRFENGDRSNDRGGIDGSEGPLVHGFLPTDTGFHHGGDLEGLTARLDYIVGLGATAIWITPPFTNRTVQGGGEIANSSSGYHGYWQVDWSQVDPHLGTEEDMQAFIAAAKDRGLKVFFDVVMNHTGDVIFFEEDRYSYRTFASAPYLDADGNEFDPVALAGSPDFPELGADVSFPYTPTFATPEDATIKSPDWLNDPTVYHNRGNSTFQGDSSLFGDFFGLDDLFTEDPRVVSGMIELYTDIIQRYDIDGFRVDTAKHVNDEFWAEFMPAIRQVAAEQGKPDFFMFGEVFSTDPILMSRYPTLLSFSSVLDFIFDNSVIAYVSGSDGTLLEQAFDDDDWYTDADSNASMLVKFLGNHDEGRLGYFISQSNPRADDEELLARIRLAYDLMFTTRGVPLVYYGDEQGFTGTGGDQLARQSMFPSETPEYLDDISIGSGVTPGEDNFDPSHPLYTYLGGLQQLRMDHPTLVTGAQITRAATAGIFAFSRIDRDDRIEYVIATNNRSTPSPVTVPTSTPEGVFTTVYGEAQEATAGQAGVLSVTVPAYSSIVLRADRPAPLLPEPVTVNLERPRAGIEIPTFIYRMEVELGDLRYAEVTFSASVDGGPSQLLGVDDAPPYRLYWHNGAVPDGAEVEITVAVDDGSGEIVSTSNLVTMGARR